MTSGDLFHQDDQHDWQKVKHIKLIVFSGICWPLSLVGNDYVSNNKLSRSLYPSLAMEAIDDVGRQRKTEVHSAFCNIFKHNIRISEKGQAWAQCGDSFGINYELVNPV